MRVRRASAAALVALLQLGLAPGAWAQNTRPGAPPPVPTSAPDSPAQLPTSEEELQRRLALRHWALAGVTVVLLSGGVVFGVQSRNSLEDARQAQFQVGAYDALKQARVQAISADALFLGAALAAVAGVITYFVSPPLPPKQKPEEKK